MSDEPNKDQEENDDDGIEIEDMDIQGEIHELSLDDLLDPGIGGDSKPADQSTETDAHSDVIDGEGVADELLEAIEPVPVEALELLDQVEAGAEAGDEEESLDEIEPLDEMEALDKVEALDDDETADTEEESHEDEASEEDEAPDPEEASEDEEDDTVVEAVEAAREAEPAEDEKVEEKKDGTGSDEADEGLIDVSSAESITPISPKIEKEEMNGTADEAAPPATGELHRAEWVRISEQLERELTHVEDASEKAVMLFSLGEILELQLGDTERAVLRYQQAYMVDPSHQPTLKAAARMFKEVGRWDMVIELLEAQEKSTLTDREIVDLKIEQAQVYGTRLDQRSVAIQRLEEALKLDPKSIAAFKLMEKFYAAEKDVGAQIEFYNRYIQDPNFANMHLALLQNLARIQDKSDHLHEDAVVSYKKIIEFEPTNLLAISALKRLLVRHKHWDDLAEVYFQEEKITDDPARKAVIKYLQARINSDHRKDPERAEALLDEGLQIDPGNALLLDELENIYNARKEYSKLIDINVRQYELAEDVEKRIEIAFKLGNLLLEQAEDLDEASKWYEKALEAKRDYLPALHILGKLYARAGNDEKLLEILKLEAECVEDPKLKANKYFMVAEHANNRLNDHDKAIEAYRMVLDLSPGYLPAIKAVSGLYSFLGRTGDMIEMNELQISTNPDLNTEQYVYLLEKNAFLWEHLGSLEKAIECHRRILGRRKNYLSSIQVLGRLYAKIEDWEELIDINRIEAELINDQHRIISLLCKNGEICEGKLENTDRAIDFYRHVLTLSPSYLPAVKALGAIYQHRGLWNDLIKMYQRELESLNGSGQATSIRFKVAQIYDEELNDPQKAELHYRETLKNDPNFTPSLHALTKLCNRENNFAALIEIYEGQISRTEDRTTKLLALYKVAELYENKLQDLENSEKTYLKIMEMDPNNLAARRGLFRLYAQTGKHREQLQLIEPELEEQTSVSGRLSLLAAIADIYNELEDDQENCARAYGQILDIDPDNGVAFQVLEQLYLKMERYEDLVDIYEARLERTEDDADKLPLLWVAIDILESNMDDFDRLQVCYREVIRIEPYNPRAMEFFEEGYARECQWRELLDIYQRMRTLTEDKMQLLRLYLSAGQILELELGAPDQALQQYKSALSLQQNNFMAIQGIKRAYAKLEKWTELVSILEKELENPPSSQGFIATAYQLGYIRESKFNQREAASILYCRVLEMEPGHKEAYLRAKKLLTEDRNHQKLVEIYEQRLLVLSSVDEQLDLHRQIADLAETSLVDIEQAMRHRERLVEMDSENVEGLIALADLYNKSSRWEEAIELYERAAPKLDDTKELRHLNFKIGCIYQEELNNASQAVSSFETVLAYEAGDLHAMERLGTLYQELGLTEESIEILTKLLDHTLPRDKEIRCNLAMGAIYMDKMRDEKLAIPYLEKALALDPNNKDVLDKLFSMFEKRGNWDRLIRLYEDSITVQSAEHPDKVMPMLIGLANVYIEKVKDVENALKVLERAHDLDPENLDVQAMQANAMGLNALFYLDAIDKHRQLLSFDPFRVNSYRELHRIFSERNENDRAFCTLACLDFLRALDDKQAKAYRDLRDQSAAGIAATISPREQENLLIHSDESGLLRDIFLKLESALYKLNPVDLKSYDLPNCKVAGVNSSVYHLMENAAYHLGVDLFKVYISQKKPELLAVENTKPPTVVLGGNLAFSSESIKRFLSGMIMSRIQHGHILFADSSLDELRFWIECACHLYIPEFPVKHSDASEVEKFVSKLNRAVPKSARKELEELIRQFYKQEGEPDYAGFKLSQKHTENRMGLLLAGDLISAAECLVYLKTGKPYRPGGTSASVSAAFDQNEEIRKLLSFSVSDEYFELRKLIRISLD